MLTVPFGPHLGIIRDGTQFPAVGENLPLSKSSGFHRPLSPTTLPTYHQMFPFLFILFTRLAYSCFPTAPVGPSTTSPPSGCCPTLTQTLTTTEFPDGMLTFAYNNPTCYTSVLMTCSQTDPAVNLNAAIYANGQSFLDYGASPISYTGTCNTATQQWVVGQPPLVVTTLECLLSNPPSTNTTGR